MPCPGARGVHAGFDRASTFADVSAGGLVSSKWP